MNRPIAKLDRALSALGEVAAAFGDDKMSVTARRAREALKAAPGATASKRLIFLADLVGQVPSENYILTSLADLLKVAEPKQSNDSLSRVLPRIVALAAAEPDLAELAMAAAKEAARQKRQQSTSKREMADIRQWVSAFESARLDSEAFASVFQKFTQTPLTATEQKKIVETVTGIGIARLNNAKRRREELERWHAHELREHGLKHRRAMAASRF